MRLLAVSDRLVDHLYASDVGTRYSDIDLIVGCGDLPFYYLEFLLSALNTPLVYVKGNHDDGPQYTAEGRVLTSVDGGEEIHRRITFVNGLLVAGLEGSMRYRPNAPLMYSETEMRWNVAQLLPSLLWSRIRHGRPLDILVTHSPPYLIHDRSDLAHRGFKVFRTLLQRFRPRYMLHGHVHVYRNDIPRVTRFVETTVINVYPYRIFEYGAL
jgi:Icc-related predicted phosphoesterase